MDAQSIIAKRLADELKPGMLVNLGIGIPTLVADYVPAGMALFFQSENGLIGTGPVAEEGMVQPLLTDAGGQPVTALPGASTFDSAMSFGLIRGGHVDLTILGGLQVDAKGHLANWMIPGKMVPGMGGAMDLVTGARRVIVAMQQPIPSRAAPRLHVPRSSMARWALSGPWVDGRASSSTLRSQPERSLRSTLSANPSGSPNSIW